MEINPFGTFSWERAAILTIGLPLMALSLWARTHLPFEWRYLLL